MPDVRRLQNIASTVGGEPGIIRVYRSYNHPDIRTRLWRRLAEEYEVFVESNSRAGRDTFLDHMINCLANWDGEFRFLGGDKHDPIRHHPSSKTIYNLIKHFDKSKTESHKVLSFVHCFLSVIDPNLSLSSSDSQEFSKIVQFYRNRYVRVNNLALLDVLLSACRRLSGLYTLPDVAIPTLKADFRRGQSRSKPLFFVDALDDIPLVKVHMIYEAHSRSVNLEYSVDPDIEKEVPIYRASGIAIPFINDFGGLNFTFHLARKTESGAPIDFHAQFSGLFSHYFNPSDWHEPYVMWTCRHIGEPMPTMSERDQAPADVERIYNRTINTTDFTGSPSSSQQNLEQLHNRTFNDQNIGFLLEQSELEEKYYGLQAFERDTIVDSITLIKSFAYDRESIKHFALEEYGANRVSVFTKYANASKYWKNLFAHFGNDI